MNLLRNILIFVLTLTLGACGPNKAELRSKLMKVEAEMSYLNSLAQSQRDRMTAADFTAFIGGFAAGYGGFSGNGDLAAQGAGAILDADQQSRDAQLGLNQIQARYNELALERFSLLSKLR